MNIRRLGYVAAGLAVYVILVLAVMLAYQGMVPGGSFARAVSVWVLYIQRPDIIVNAVLVGIIMTFVTASPWLRSLLKS